MALKKPKSEGKLLKIKLQLTAYIGTSIPNNDLKRRVNGTKHKQMDAKIIQKYSKRKTKNLEATAQRHFNKYIRLRDCDEYGYGNCISSGRPIKYSSAQMQAGHFFPVGQYPALRFNEDNVHAQSKSDNYFKSGNLIEYRYNLLKKLGEERMRKLEEAANASKRTVTKKDRFFYIEIIEKYKAKCKELKRQKMF